jgi:undecaprenyl-diphosphatase
MKGPVPAAERVHLHQMKQTKNNPALKSVFVVFIFLFFVLSLLFNKPPMEYLDSSISNFVVSNRIGEINSFSIFLSHLFEPFYAVIIIFLLGIILWVKNKKKDAAFLVAISFVSAVSVFLIKQIFMRPRPLIQFIAETGYSFPSGHSLIAVIIFGSFVYFFFKKVWGVWIYSLFCVLIVGLSRIYLNVHWFSDVIGGFLLGGIILLGAILLLESSICRRLINLNRPK